MDYLYSFTLKLLYPTSLCLVLLLLSAVLSKWRRTSRSCFWLAVLILLVCGNGWLVEAMTERLERQYQALDQRIAVGLQDKGTTGQRDQAAGGPLDPGGDASKVQTIADCILVLSGGLWPKMAPRPTIEIGEAGDRMLYAARLYREGKARYVVCTGEKGPGGIVFRPVADDMAEMLQSLGVPPHALVTEGKSQTTAQHALNLGALLHELGFKRVLLVTSAMHMPRAMGVFQKLCPGVEFIPAPTDFRCVERPPRPWYQELHRLLPTPKHLLGFAEAAHEYLGMAYYRTRGWL